MNVDAAGEPPLQNGHARPSRILSSDRAITLLLAFALPLGSWLGISLPSPPTRAAENAEPGAGTELFFEDQIAPLLEKHCAECHTTDDPQAMLDLSSAAGLVRGSQSGPVLTARNRERSLLYEVVRDGEMPPEEQALPPEEIELLGRWLDGGARFRNPPEGFIRMVDEHQVLPILLLRCTACHGAKLRRGNLDLRSIKSLLAGGESGPAAIAGAPDESLMIRRVESEACPPPGQLLTYFVARPSPSEVQTLRSWIGDGMPRETPVASAGTLNEPDPSVTEADRRHWSFRPLPPRIEVPHVAGVDRLQPVDAFIAAKLKDQGLDFSPPADRQQRIRRLYIDLTGLPPTVDELRIWMDTPRSDWYPALVDTLLASPRYGERWGRHWLDLAGYADSEGGQSEDPVRAFAWKYRDYVIRSFNSDKPWDRFLLEQLAGDELADYRRPELLDDAVIDNLIATGFLRMGIDETGSRTMNFVPERLGLISDALNVVSSGIMGLTLECARCHNHKYDPIPQSDYYRFKAIFQGAFDEYDWLTWKDRNLDLESSAESVARKTHNAPLEKLLKQLREQRKAWLKSNRTDPRMTEATLVASDPRLAVELQAIDQEIEQAEQELIPPPTVRALWDRGRPSPTYVLVRGEHDRPGRQVDPGIPSALSDGTSPITISPPWPSAESTGRRLALARWIVDPGHPLTARVLVNRIWSLHMGRGIVATLDNFGLQGAAPTHPELLDWLARDLIDNGWSLKSLHRQILLSRVYQQSSRTRPEHQQLDPENHLWSRMNVRRFDAEALHDSLLAIAGRLSDTMYGPPAPVAVREDGLVMALPEKDGRLRRSIYVQLRRTEIPTLLGLFDYPEMNPNCIQRSTSTVSLQALVLHNNGQVHEWAGDLANLILARANESGNDLINETFLTVYSRQPTADEHTEAQQHLAQIAEMWREAGNQEPESARLALRNLCHTLINSAEFSYID